MSAMRRYLPVFHDVLGASVLVVGAGAVGTRKIEALLAGGARVTVVAKEFSPAVEERAARGDLTALRGTFHPDQMEEAELVFAATSDRALNRRVSVEARRRRIPVNVADSPEECTFLLPAVVRGEEFTAAISTGGRNPGGGESAAGIPRGAPGGDLGPPGAGTTPEADRGEAGKGLHRRRRAGRPRPAHRARAGAAAQRGRRHLRLPRPRGRSSRWRPAKAARICFARRGRTAGHGAALKQNAIHEAMVRLAREGKSVVRLKSGDPLVFGRGGEEAEHLSREGVPFEIVPGITAAMGCAAAAALPLTHRGPILFRHLRRRARNRRKGGKRRRLEPAAEERHPRHLHGSRPDGGDRARNSPAAGFSPDTPVRRRRERDRPEQRILRGDLSGPFPDRGGIGVRSPAILFVGRTAAVLPYENTEESIR